MNKKIKRITQYFFILLAVAIPTSIAITNIIIYSIVLFWILDGGFKQKMEKIFSLKWVKLLFCLMGVYFLGLFWGNNHNHSSWVFQKLILLITFPIFITLDLEQKTIRRSVIAFLSTLFISGLIAIAININIISPLSEYISFISDREITSAFIQYNYHNVLLSFGVFICMYIIIEKQSSQLIIFILFICGYVISIFTELGRAGQLLVFLIFMFYIIYYNINSPFKLIKYITLFFCLQFFIYQFSMVYQERVDNTVYKITHKGFKPNNNTMKDIRYVMLERSIEKIKQKPILGYGTGSFKTIYDNEIKRNNNIDWRYNHMTPHNNYLFVAFELGLVGLFIFLLIFYYKIQELKNQKHGIHKALLPTSFMILMCIDSYFFIFTIMASYIYLYTIYFKYKIR